ncbi:MAG TPA: fatty acid desaturase [Chthoniobacteraceae bacterium]|nr:fatty acid desaturase [Chthoniobacteraceae bacterium]
MKIFNVPSERINWKTSVFLIGTFVLSITAVPAYIWHYGLSWFQVTMFMVLFVATGLSITLGYHRLFSHLAFKAHWSVRFLTLFFGAAAFENSALMWCCEHRRHHKHVDHEEDPYDISKGFFHAHIGWLLFKMDAEPPYDNVVDLQQDPLVRLQHRYIHPLAFFASFVLPAAIGWAWGGPACALGAFLIGGVARVVAVQHSTFFINSACHTIGSRPYSSRCSARDSWIMALFTFGEGYHNYHHEFQHDYRNGVKPWQFDPTKWTIWLLSKMGLASKLRRVPSEKILLAQLAETQRQFESKLQEVEPSSTVHTLITTAYERLQKIAHEWAAYRDAKLEVTREKLIELQFELKLAISSLKIFHQWDAAVS